MNFRIEKADHYLRQHRIIELFEDLSTSVAYEQPNDIKAFLVQLLQVKQKHGFKTGLFKPEEVDNIFTLFDLRREGWISKQQAIEAVKTLAASQFQIPNESEFGEKVTRKDFLAIVEKQLGIKTS